MNDKSYLEVSLLQQIHSAGLPEPETEYRAISGRRFRWDGAYPYHKVLYEVQGGIWSGRYGKQSGHSSGAGISRDCEKNNLAVLAGWKVLYFTGEMIKDGSALQTLEKVLKKN